MKIFTKIIAVFLLLLFIISIFASSVLADPSSISLTSKWTTNNDTQLSVTSGDEAELFVFVSSTANFKLWVDVYDGGNKIKSVINNMLVPANTQTTYFQNFKINTDNLGSFSGKDYKVRVHVMNTNTAQSTNAWLDLKVTKKYVFKPWIPIHSPFPKPGNHAPTVSPIPNKQINEGPAPKLKFNVVGTDLDVDDNNYLTYNFQRKIGIWLPINAYLPDGANFNKYTGEFTFLADYDFVKHPNLEKNLEFRFRADDGKDHSDWEYVNILVKDVNRIPIFTSVGDQEIFEGETLELPFDGSDQDNDELHYFFDEDIVFPDKEFPEGSNLVDVSKFDGLFTWTPNFEQAGNYEMRIWVMDNYGGKTYEDIKIKVKDVPEVPIYQCSDGADNDGDGFVDLHDPGCDSPEDDDESDDLVEDPVYQCNDDADNDEDGLVDMADPGCESPEDDDEFNVVEPLPQCNDGLDNDEDGFVDYPADPGCDNSEDDDEEDEVIVEEPDPTQCDDGLDNDNDGLIDYIAGLLFGDPGCDNPEDDDEFNEIIEDPEEPDPTQCDDNLDNDGDGLIDYPSDPGCDNSEDNDEFNEIVEEPEEPSPEEPQVPYTNIKFKSIQVAQEGNYAYLSVNMLNNGDKDLEDLRVTAIIYSLGAKGSSSGKFTLESGENINKNVYVPLNYSTSPGWYLVKITVKNSHYHDSAYRLLHIS